MRPRWHFLYIRQGKTFENLQGTLQYLFPLRLLYRTDTQESALFYWHSYEVQGAPIKWPPTDLEQPAVLCSQLRLLAHGPPLISLVFFAHHHNKLATGSIAAPSLYCSFVCFILIPSSQPLPSSSFPSSPRCYPSSAGTLPISDAYQLAFTANEIHPFFSLPLSPRIPLYSLSFTAFLNLVSLTTHPHHLLSLSLLCAPGICSYIFDLRLMSTLLFTSTNQLIRVNPERWSVWGECWRFSLNLERNRFICFLQAQFLSLRL